MMDEHERGYTEGYQQALTTIKQLLDSGMPIGAIKECVEEELTGEESL